MKCTDKERETCQVEKLGCKGCAYYDGLSLEEVEKAKEQLISLRENAKVNIDTDEIFRLDYEAINTILQYISELESNNYEQNSIINNYIEIEEEHQKLVGELIEENKALKEQKK